MARAATHAGHAELSPRDEIGIREVVKAQLDAIASEDEARAFSMAAPAVRHNFGNPKKFMAMVRDRYPMVLRPASVSFTIAEPEGKSVMQRVNVTDTQGAAWLVTYVLERQRDRRWRITACVAMPARHRLVV